MDKEQEKIFMERYPDLVKYLVINDLCFTYYYLFIISYFDDEYQ